MLTWAMIWLFFINQKHMTVDPDNPQGGSSFYDGFDDDDESDQMPFGWEGL
jgi:hypothetical protein